MTSKQMQAVASYQEDAAKELLAVQRWDIAKIHVSEASARDWYSANFALGQAAEALLNANYQTNNALSSVVSAFAPPSTAGWLGTALVVAKYTADAGTALACAFYGTVPCVLAAGFATSTTIYSDARNHCSLGQTLGDTLLGIAGFRFASITAIGAKYLEAGAVSDAIQYGYKGGGALVGLTGGIVPIC